MTQYEETQLPDEDMASAILEQMAGGKPFLFIVASNVGDGLGIQVTTGGGIRDTTLVRKLLTLSLKALPAEDNTEKAPDLEQFRFPGYPDNQVYLHPCCGTVIDVVPDSGSDTWHDVETGNCDCENRAPWRLVYVEKAGS